MSGITNMLLGAVPTVGGGGGGTGPGVGNGDNGLGGIPGGAYSGGSIWVLKNGPIYVDNNVESVVDYLGDSVALGTIVNYTSGSSPWTAVATTKPVGFVVSKIAGSTYFTDLDSNGTMYYSTNLSTWTSVSAPSTWTTGTSQWTLLSDGTNAVVVFSRFNGVNHDIKSAAFNGSTWNSPVTILASNIIPNFYAMTTGTNKYTVLIKTTTGGIVQHGKLFATSDGASSWLQDTTYGAGNAYDFFAGLVFSKGDSKFYTWHTQVGEVQSAPIATFDGGAKDSFDPSTFSTVYTVTMDDTTNSILMTVDNDPNGTVVLTGQMFYTDGYFDIYNPTAEVVAYMLNDGVIYQPFGNLTGTTFPFDFVSNANLSYGRVPIIYSSATSKFYAIFNEVTGDVMSTSDLTTAWGNSVNPANSGIGADLMATASDGGSNLVVVGDLGTVAHSSDTGSTWAQVTSNTPQALWSIVYGDKFVAVGTYGGIVYSSTGATWTSASIGGGDSMYSVAWGITPAKYVAIGSGDVTSGGTWNYSSNGISWTTITPSVNCTWNKVRWLNDRFVGLGQGSDGALIYSTTGTSTSFGVTSATASLEDAAYGNGTIVAVGFDGSNAVIYYSTNGTTYNSATVPSNTNVSLFHIVYANSKFVAVGSDGDNNDIVTYTGTDGITWTKNITGIGTLNSNWIEWDGSKYLIATRSNNSDNLNTNLWSSTLGTTTWSAVTTNIEGPINAVTAMADKNVFVGQVGTLQAGYDAAPATQTVVVTTGNPGPEKYPWTGAAGWAQLGWGYGDTHGDGSSPVTTTGSIDNAVIFGKTVDFIGVHYEGVNPSRVGAVNIGFTDPPSFSSVDIQLDGGTLFSLDVVDADVSLYSDFGITGTDGTVYMWFVELQATEAAIQTAMDQYFKRPTPTTFNTSVTFHA